MKRLPLLTLLLAAAGCPSTGNPHQLWLAQDGSEAMVKLAEDQVPF